jgi:Protein of unknown function (DUF1553)/Protein of unknown function (DUF1549)/Planctomycete cytochrome C/Concanavalin A-like lectin/glucanases superfamily
VTTLPVTTAPRFRRLPLIAVLTGLAGSAFAAAAPVGEVKFNRDIRPILAEACYHCHGPDPASRKAKLRFDREEDFTAKREDGFVIVKGKPAESLMWQRLISKDEDEVMPPPDAHIQLKPEQKELLRRWIEQGASWQKHWSFMAIERPAEPKTKDAKWAKNSIDRFVLARLEEAKLTPAPEADRRTLARRLSLDLTGLPPKSEQVEAFVADKRPDAYELFVDQLLASPQYGEHRARYWLDAARYADTHGVHFDNYREMWPYRDWVINAFNSNQKFDQFTIEQIAGDLLPNPTVAQKVATGFHRCNITTNEGGTIEEENLVSYARDRVETTSWVWLGLTANCASCHDHKFDPISQRDFYAMSAYFRNTTQKGLDGNIKDTPPILVLPKDADKKRYEELPPLIETAKKERDEARKNARANFDTWLKTATMESWEQELAKDRAPVQRLPLTGPAKDDALHGSAGDKALVATSAKPVEWVDDGPFGPAAKVNGEMAISYSEVADFEKDKPYSVSAWVKIAKDTPDGAIFGRMDNEDGFRGWDLYLQGSEFSSHLVHRWDNDALKVRTKGNQVKRDTWQHIVITYDGSAKPAGLKIWVNGKYNGFDKEADTLKSTTRTAAPFQLARRKSTNLITNVALQQIQFYDHVLANEAIARQAATPEARKVLATAVDKRDGKAIDRLFEVMDDNDQPLVLATKKLQGLEEEMKTVRERATVTHIQEEKMNSKAMAHILFRGEYDKRKDEVEPAPFHALHAPASDAPKNRLGLAQWLVAKDSGLTPRVIVNRYWQELFGTGLVKSSEDFGIMGDAPSHPELLDWLAAEFKSDWDVKRLFKLMVTSATYRQTAIANEQKIEKDPANRLLSRGPRFRMDAEVIRDYALSVSGLLSPTIGGPSVKPYQPEGVWEAVGMRESNTKNYKRDSGEALWRRSMYSFWKRMSPPAAMEIMGAPNREVSCLRRERSNTPLQALVTLNDEQFIEAARVLAEHVLKAPAESRVAEAGKRILLRPFTAAELPLITASHTKLLAHYQANVEAAKTLIAVGERKADAALPPAELAAMTMLCNALLNLDEVLNK